AQLTLNSSFDASEILAYRKKVKEKSESFGAANITLNDMILYAVSRILKKHGPLNAQLIEENLLVYDHVHLGVAVDTARGLMVPVIRDADTKSLAALSSEAKELIESCQKGTVNPDLLKGGTFTVTNLGTLGVESFTPVLNAPQTGILGVCNIVQRIRLNGKDNEFYPAMGLSLTFDHRAVDGAPAARFLKDLAAALEDFTLIAAMG
ncbi:MAG: 2-oxo acid dehydrogenase subunit E2, partial [Eubacteriales bacterium]|nr:2-oxo acid dehydrogenase subunit E2 [Eubacteriales bacterium]